MYMTWDNSLLVAFAVGGLMTGASFFGLTLLYLHGNRKAGWLMQRVGRRREAARRRQDRARELERQAKRETSQAGLRELEKAFKSKRDAADNIADGWALAYVEAMRSDDHVKIAYMEKTEKYGIYSKLRRAEDIIREDVRLATNPAYAKREAEKREKPHQCPIGFCGFRLASETDDDGWREHVIERHSSKVSVDDPNDMPGFFLESLAALGLSYR